MNNEHVKGAVNEVKGKIKENVGHMSGKNKMEGEGVLDQVKGKVQKELGNIKDAFKKGVDTALNKH